MSGLAWQPRAKLRYTSKMSNPCFYIFPLQILSAFTAFLAAAFWLAASLKKVPDEFNRQRLEELNGDIVSVLSRQSKALSVQGKLNARAAACAGLAALTQITLAFMPACWWGGW
jgi:hypothetical protein